MFSGSPDKVKQDVRKFRVLSQSFRYSSLLIPSLLNEKLLSNVHEALDPMKKENKLQIMRQF